MPCDEKNKRLLNSLFVGYSLSVLLFIPNLISDNAINEVAYQAVLGIFSLIATAWMYILIQRKPTRTNIILITALFIKSFIHLGSSINLLFSLSVSEIELIVRRVVNATDMMVFSLLILLGLLLKNPENMTKTPRRILSWIIILLTSLSWGTFQHYLIRISTIEMLQSIGTTLSLCSIFTFTLIILQITRNTEFHKNFDRQVILSAMILLLSSSVMLLISFLSYERIWSLAMNLEVFALLGVSISVAGKRDSNYQLDKKQAFLMPVITSAPALIAFTTALTVEFLTPNLQVVDLGAYLISHICAASLSATIAVMLFLYTKTKPSWNLYPLLILYAIWMMVEIQLILFWRGPTSIVLGESMVPYAVGSIAALICLYNSIRYTYKQPESIYSNPKRRILSSIILFTSAMWSAEILTSFLDANIIGFDHQLIARSILISVNLIAMFGFVLITFLTVRKTNSFLTIESFSSTFLSLWIIPNLLKGIYRDWYVGWWIAEIILLVGLIIGPAILAKLYLDSMVRSAESKEKATLYSDILIHDITNMHQAILVALSIIEHEELPHDTKRNALNDAISSLSRADQLISNVRKLVMADEKIQQEFKPVSVNESIRAAIEQACVLYPDEQIGIDVLEDKTEYFISANGLLVDLFSNLIRNAINYSTSDTRIEFYVNRVILSSSSWIQIRIEDYGKGIPPEIKANLFTRFMRTAEGTGLGLALVAAITKMYNGTVEVNNRIEGDYSKGTVFVLTFPEYTFPLDDYIT